jgi:hypothetical protein
VCSSLALGIRVGAIPVQILPIMVAVAVMAAPLFNICQQRYGMQCQPSWTQLTFISRSLYFNEFFKSYFEIFESSSQDSIAFG